MAHQLEWHPTPIEAFKRQTALLKQDARNAWTLAANIMHAAQNESSGNILEHVKDVPSYSETSKRRTMNALQGARDVFVKTSDLTTKATQTGVVVGIEAITVGLNLLGSGVVVSEMQRHHQSKRDGFRLQPNIREIEALETGWTIEDTINDRGSLSLDQKITHGFKTSDLLRVRRSDLIALSTQDNHVVWQKKQMVQAA